MKNLFQRSKDFKGKVPLQELRRAHVIIALLAFSLAFILTIDNIYPVQLDLILSSVVSGLLVIVAGLSLSIAAVIKSK